MTSVNRLLAERGFDLMTVDQVAADAGIAKASLYKHFASKEALAAAAMVRILKRADELVVAQASRTAASACDKLVAVTRWALEQQLRGEMPSLPSQNSSLRAELLGNKAYLDLLMKVSDQLGEWILRAQQDGDLDASLPPEVVLYTIYARGCDPVPGFLKASNQYSDEQIVDLVLKTCFSGLRSRAAAAAATSAPT